MATLVYTIKVNSADAREYAPSGPGHKALVNGANLLRAFAGGSALGNVDVQRSDNDPVRAAQTATLTYASISNNDTVVIAGTTLTCVTGTPSGYTQFKKQTDATVTAANMVAAITGNTTLNKFVSATSTAGVVTITCRVPGTIGNTLTLVGSTGIVAGGAVFASGAGGSESTQTAYRG
jgi:phage tail sheath gpL-like